MTEKYTVSAAEMKEIERIADAKGLPYRQMMENAGTMAFKTMREKWPTARRPVIFAGKGNNGGDGFVVARLYDSAEFLPKAEVTVILCEGIPVTEDASYNFGLLEKEHVENVKILMLADYDKAFDAVKGADLIVDAVYGTGFHGSLRESGRKAAALMKGAGVPVCSLDIPSGMNADTGEIAEGAVKADVTVVFHILKHGHAVPEAEKQCGEIIKVDIGIR